VIAATLERSSARALLPLLALLFFCSGASALVYQVLWLRMFGWVFGVTVYAASTVWGSFMTGLAGGSLVAAALGERVALLYGSNTAGAIVGTLSAGLWLIPTPRRPARNGRIRNPGASNRPLLRPQRRRCHRRIARRRLRAAAVVRQSPIAQRARRREPRIRAGAPRRVRVAPSGSPHRRRHRGAAVRRGGDAFARSVRTVLAVRFPGERIVWRDEGVEATVVVHQSPGGDRSLTINGNHQASTDAGTTYVHRRIGHLPMALHPDPRTVLVIGLGGGATAGAVSVHGPSVEIVELSGSVVRAAPMFAGISYDVLSRPNVRLRGDDGRNFLLLTPQLRRRHRRCHPSDLCRLRQPVLGRVLPADPSRAESRRHGGSVAGRH
jgi:hypothetical protein